MSLTAAPSDAQFATPAHAKTLLRLATAGSVDDGKSTLIGRLLFDAKQVLADQLEHVEEASRRRGGAGAVDLSLLTDGLRAEREQGITIDVAYRSFATPRRRFLIADTPGHAQYTRNMVTGASTADLALILLDARHGVVEQTRRHAYLSALLGTPRLTVCVNKMDLLDWSEERFTAIVEEFTSWAERLELAEVAFIPISALHGDNVVERSARTPWYDGPPLLAHLEEIDVAATGHWENRPARFPVQWVIRPRSDEHHDFRGYAGRVAGGALAPGDDVVVLPSGRPTRVAAVETWDGPLGQAVAPLSVTVRLEDDLDVSRGEMLCSPEEQPVVSRELEATVCWMADAPLRAGGRYALKHTTRSVRAVVEEVIERTDVETLSPDGAASAGGGLGLNDIGRVRLRTSAPLVVDPYRVNRTTGSFILIDEGTNATVGAGMVLGAP